MLFLDKLLRDRPVGQRLFICTNHPSTHFLAISNIGHISLTLINIIKLEINYISDCQTNCRFSSLSANSISHIIYSIVHSISHSSHSIYCIVFIVCIYRKLYYFYRSVVEVKVSSFIYIAPFKSVYKVFYREMHMCIHRKENTNTNIKEVKY